MAEDFHLESVSDEEAKAISDDRGIPLDVARHFAADRARRDWIAKLLTDGSPEEQVDYLLRATLKAHGHHFSEAELHEFRQALSVDPAAGFKIEPITDEAVRKLSRADDVDSMAYAYLLAWHQAHMAVIHRLFAKGSVEDKVNYMIEADIARKEDWIGSGDRESLQREPGPITAQRAEASGPPPSDDPDIAERNRLYRLMFRGSRDDKITYLMTQKIQFLDACLAATGEELLRYRSVSCLLYL